MSKQVLRSKKCCYLSKSKVVNLSADNTYINNYTSESFIVSNECNSINIVPTEYDIGYTQPNSIIIGQNHALNTTKSIIIGSNITTNINNVDTISIGNNINNNIIYEQHETLHIGNNNCNSESFFVTVGNNNYYNITANDNSSGSIIGSENFYVSSLKHNSLVIGNNNTSYNTDITVIGCHNTFNRSDDAVYVYKNTICGQNNTLNTIVNTCSIGNSNMMSYCLGVTTLGSYNTMIGNDTNDSLLGVVVIGNHNGKNINSLNPLTSSITVIGNENINTTQLFSKQLVIGTQNINIVDPFHNGSNHNSICIGNNNQVTRNSIIFGSGCKSFIQDHVIFNTYSVDYIQDIESSFIINYPNGSNLSKFIINCPFGSNISSNPNDRNKIFYDQTKKKLFYNIL